MSAALTPNEEAQLAQTIEMFEVITQSQPLDYQSLEILKEAYSKLGRNESVIKTSKRIAEAYVELGQLSSAILEYESILQRFPDDADVQKALQAIESRANSFSEPEADLVPAPVAAPTGAAAPAKKGGDTGLIKMSPIPASSPLAPAAQTAVDDGRQMMQKLFLDAKLVSQGDFDMYWPAPSLKDAPKAVVDPFIQTLHEKQILPIDKAMKLLAEKSRLAYLPLEKYDVDIEMARTFPREVCLRWAVLPFDRMSKSVMVATANPFNKQAARELEAHTKSRLLFYLATPAELTKILKKIFR